MEKIIKGFYRSSFSTTELDSRKRDVIFRKIKVEGRKTLTNTDIVSEIPTDLVFLKTNIDNIQNVELYPVEDSFIPFNTDLHEIKWVNIRVSSEQEVDGVMHGIIEAEIYAKYNRTKKVFQKATENELSEVKTIEKESMPIIDSPTQVQNKGCFSIPRVGCLPMLKNGCLSLFFWLFLILLLIGLFRKCSENDFEKVNKTDVTETNPLDTLKLKQEGKDSIKYIERDNRIETIKTVALPNVQFFTNSDQLLPASKQDLDGLARYLLENLNSNAEIIGHTDNVGGLQKNMKLSFDRANAVKNYLIKKGIDGNRIQATGKGPTEPRASNDIPEGRLMNRRVEVKISQKSTN
jgi:outer membrane protein OmpA-like peptidoglycan-associated protein